VSSICGPLQLAERLPRAADHAQEVAAVVERVELVDHVRRGVGHVHALAVVHGHAARRARDAVGDHAQELVAGLGVVEHLHPAATGVRHEHPAGLVHRDPGGAREQAAVGIHPRAERAVVLEQGRLGSRREGKREHGKDEDVRKPQAHEKTTARARAGCGRAQRLAIGSVRAMSERTQYAPGTFSWADLSTTDQDAAKAFYSGLFGWQADDRPVGDGVVYSMMQLRGKDAAAISPQPQQQAEAGVPPMWNSYITVEDADATAARAGELGATVHAPPFDVMDVGRMAVIQDPQGAFFMLWQPKSHIGAGLVNEPGALCWNELQSPDVDASATFYGDLFGWETQQFEGSPDPYLVVMNNGRGNGAISPGSPRRAADMARLLRHRGHEHRTGEGRAAGRHEAGGPDRHRHREDRHRAGPAGRRVRALRRRTRAVALTR